MGLGVDRLELPCSDGNRVVWGNSGGGPGYNSYALTSDDASRQLVVAMNVYDIAKELAGESPIPEGATLTPAMQATFC
jgi:D-alanyl-D-alanine carboxypeptidase